MSALETLFPKVRAEILRLLFANAGHSLHLRDLVRLSGLAVGTIQAEVRKLTEAELLTQRRDGNRLYFQANRNHPLFPELQNIALKTTGLTAQLQEALANVVGVDLAFVYGSFASGNAVAESDIDLMVIGNIGLRKLSPLLRNVSDTMSREVNPHVMGRDTFVEKQKSKDAYISSVASSPKLWIIGNDDGFKRLA